MAGVPSDIPGLGPASQVVRQNPDLDPTKLPFSSQDYFVWSRVDGRATLRELILVSGFGTEQAVEALVRLYRLGAIMLPDDTHETVAERVAAAQAQAAREARAVADEDLTDEERAALAEDVALSEEHRRRVIAMARVVRSGDYFAMLDVDRDADRRTIKRAYFKISKDFHPDRFYGKETGSFGAWLGAIFEAATRAFNTLSDDTMRERYEALLDGRVRPGDAPRAQTREEHAEELFEHGCTAETRGNPEEALKYLSAAIRVAPRARYLRRAATCAQAVGNFSLAQEYAKEAARLEPNDPSYARTLAAVFRASGMLERAEETLAAALEMNSGNDVLAAEIQSDLAAVRRERGKST